MQNALTLPGRPITNAVEEAVFLVFGGLQAAAAALSVGTPTIHAALKEGCVRTKANAERWEKATTEHGCTVPREELIGWAAWTGPSRHADPSAGTSRLGKPRSRSGLGRLPAAKPADAGLGVEQKLRRKPRPPKKRAWNSGSIERRTGTNG